MPGGRPQKLSEYDISEIGRMVWERKPFYEIANILGVSRKTISKACRNHCIEKTKIKFGSTLPSETIKEIEKQVGIYKAKCKAEFKHDGIPNFDPIEFSTMLYDTVEKCLVNYDKSKDVKFSTYLVAAFKNEILTYKDLIVNLGVSFLDSGKVEASSNRRLKNITDDYDYSESYYEGIEEGMCFGEFDDGKCADLGREVVTDALDLEQHREGAELKTSDEAINKGSETTLECSSDCEKYLELLHDLSIGEEGEIDIFRKRAFLNAAKECNIDTKGRKIKDIAFDLRKEIIAKLSEYDLPSSLGGRTQFVKPKAKRKSSKFISCPNCKVSFRKSDSCPFCHYSSY